MSREQLCVCIKNTCIGNLNQIEGKPAEFVFTDDYLSQSEHKPLLSLGQAAFIEKSITLSHRQLPWFFAQLLPSGQYYNWLCDLFAIKPEDTFLFLNIYGGNLFGGVQLLPKCEERGYSVNMLEDIRLGKFPNSWQYMALPGNHTKLPIIQEDQHFLLARNPLQAPFYLQLSNENEPFFIDNIYVMSRLANAVGLATPACFKTTDITLPKDIPGLQEQTFLIMGRIDRDPISGIPIHAETMTQAMGMAGIDLSGILDIADILQFIQHNFPEPTNALRTVIKQAVFHLLVGNTRADLSRFAIVYSDEDQPHISPVLQPISTLPYTKNQQLSLSINNLQTFSQITPESFTALCEHCELSEQDINDTVLRIVQQASNNWPNVIDNLAIPTPLYDALHQHWEIISHYF